MDFERENIEKKKLLKNLTVSMDNGEWFRVGSRPESIIPTFLHYTKLILYGFGCDK